MRISSAQLPSVTSSLRFVMVMATTRVIGSTLRGVDLVELGDPIEDAGQLLLQPRGFVFGDGDAGEMGDAMDGRAIDGHGSGANDGMDRISAPVAPGRSSINLAWLARLQGLRPSKGTPTSGTRTVLPPISATNLSAV